MAKTIEFNLYIHICGEVETEEYNGDPNELLDTILPNGWEGEIWDVTTDPSFMSKGYVKVTDIEKE